MWATCRGLLNLLLTFFVLVNAVVWWAASRAMRPVGRILQALGELRRGNLATRLPRFGVPELSRISVGFNHMAETLEYSVTENQRLTRELLKTQEMEENQSRARPARRNRTVRERHPTPMPPPFAIAAASPSAKARKRSSRSPATSSRSCAVCYNACGPRSSKDWA